jgi:hypothetical protein
MVHTLTFIYLLLNSMLNYWYNYFWDSSNDGCYYVFLASVGVGLVLPSFLVSGVPVLSFPNFTDNFNITQISFKLRMI